MINTLKSRTIKGVGWVASGQIFSQAIRYVVLVVLARLLLPSDFGLLGLGLIVVNILTTVGQLGLGAALIQRKEMKDDFLDTVFWANLGVNCLLWIAVVILAPWMAILLNDPEATSILLSLSPLFVFQALLLIPRTMLYRQMRFDQIAKAEIAGELTFGLMGIALAYTGWGVWSLVGATIIRPVAGALVLWSAYSWRPSLSFSWVSFRSLMGFGITDMGGGLLAQLVSNLDYFIVGHFWGTSALGYYTLAFQLAVLPSQRLAGVLRKVTFPSFSRLQDEIERMRYAFLRIMEYMFVGVAPIAVFLIYLSPLFIDIFYSEKWGSAIVPMQILALAGLFYSFDVADSIYYAIGKPIIRLILVLGRVGLFLVFISWFGLANGINGVAWSVTLSVGLSALLAPVAIVKILALSFSSLVVVFKRPLMATFITLCLISLVASCIPNAMPSMTKLVILFVTIGASYITSIFLFYRNQTLAIVVYLFNKFKLQRTIL